MILAAAITASALADASALALVGHGHVFAGTFEGTGENALKNPSGIAVDEASGELYVADRSAPHERVERFRSNGAGGYEFVSAFDVKSPEEIAVDNSKNESDPSRGDVYVVGALEEGVSPVEHNVLYKYSPVSGKVVFKKTLFHAEKEELELEDINGVAVDANGGLWVDWGEEAVISGFSDAEVNHWQPSLTKELEVESQFECRARPGFAVAPDVESLYVARERETALECPEQETTPALVAKADGSGEFVAGGLDQQDSTGVAVDASDGDVYVDNAGSVAAFAANGAFIQRFGEAQLDGGGAVAVDSASDYVFVAEPGEGKVAVFAPEGATAPTVDSIYAQNLSPSSERLIAQIDPHGAETTYAFQYSPATLPAPGEECTAPCVETPKPEQDIGEAFGDQTASVELRGLEPNTVYHYRARARNEHGIAESPQATQTFFTTLPSSEGVLADNREWELVSPAEKHGATIEPISREGALIQASADGDSIAWAASAPVASEPQGNRRPEPVQVISTRTNEGWSSQDIATPHDKGEGYKTGQATEYRFFSSDLSLALVQPQIPAEPFENPPLAPEASEKTMYRRSDASGEYQPLVTAANDTTGRPFGGKLEFAGATPDLQHVVFDSEVPLVPGAGELGLYEWAPGSALELVSVLPGTEQTPASEPALGDLGRDVRGAVSTDGSRVFFTDKEDEGPLYVRDTVRGETVQVNAAQGVAEPDEEEREEGVDQVHYQDASSDGSRVFFTDSWPLTRESTLEPRPGQVDLPVDLYEYDLENGELSDLTVDQRVGESAEVLGTLPGVSEDGSYVYFVANGVLAPGAEPGDCPRVKPEPYVPDPGATCNLYVSEPDPEHPGRRQTHLIARLSAEDAPDWGAGHSPPGSLGGATSRVAPNGHYLAFMSQRELTGYDNVDANPEAKGAHDQEVFLYHADTGRLVCASCNPSGQAPHGVFDTEQAGEGVGLTVDRPETWSGQWLAGSVPGWTLIGLTNPLAEHQSRYLSDSGRLFFNSADALVLQVTPPTREEDLNGKSLNVGVESVYEYEPGGEGSCISVPGCVALISFGTSDHESAFLDASENGNDVFFMTAAQLVPQDTDDSLDVYDARVCGTAGAQPCLPTKTPSPPPCSGEECRPAPSPQQSFPMPASQTSTGPGNPGKHEVDLSTTNHAKQLTRAQKLKAAVHACRKLRNRRRRLACEAKARKKYGSKTKRKAAKKSTTHATKGKR